MLLAVLATPGRAGRGRQVGGGRLGVEGGRVVRWRSGEVEKRLGGGVESVSVMAAYTRTVRINR